jgi:tetratricopeptide (TPR) repeat protein
MEVTGHNRSPVPLFVKRNLKKFSRKVTLVSKNESNSCSIVSKSVKYRSMSSLPVVTEPIVVNLEAEDIKEKGNTAFRAGDFELALQYFTAAIELDSSNPKYLVNRSLCYASLYRWEKSGEDARIAVKLDPKNHKAHFRLIKALYALERFKDARLGLLNAFKDCGESKEMKQLEDELLSLTGIPLRPKPTDFEIVGELGDGNFSKVYKALHKSTNRVFAIKVCTQFVHLVLMVCLLWSMF